MSDPRVKGHLDSLAAFPEVLRRQIEGMDTGALRYRPAPDAWSAVEVIGHIMEAEMLWAGRIRQMLAAEGPRLTPYDQNEAVRLREFQTKQPGGMLNAFAEQRAEHVAFLRGLRPGQLARTGIHPTRGPISVLDGIAILDTHDRAHGEQIAANHAAYAVERRNSG